ncbi:hypothetical protein O6H91_06G075100 [Diphasiastrum complanatum]|uniref:Uncharacterized protein n=1 Tax=Diphasiastrum complanatum TaxID=34168 RepID=A0ACC2DFF5_DIPCM|nr:hypothetical protein O6H91_06G075100 [Diphasiastrum complanatum]
MCLFKMHELFLTIGTILPAEWYLQSIFQICMHELFLTTDSKKFCICIFATFANNHGTLLNYCKTVSVHLTVVPQV